MSSAKILQPVNLIIERVYDLVYAMILPLSSLIFILWFTIFTVQLLFGNQISLNNTIFYIGLPIFFIIAFIYFRSQGEKDTWGKKVVITAGSIICLILFLIVIVSYLNGGIFIFNNQLLILFKSLNIIFNGVGIFIAILYIMPAFMFFFIVLIGNLFSTEKIKIIDYENNILYSLLFLFNFLISFPIIVYLALIYKTVSLALFILFGFSITYIHFSYLYKLLYKKNKLVPQWQEFNNEITIKKPYIQKIARGKLDKAKSKIKNIISKIQHGEIYTIVLFFLIILLTLILVSYFIVIAPELEKRIFPSKKILQSSWIKEINR